MNMPPLTSGTKMVGGAAIIGVVAGFWNYIKVYLSKIYSLFVVRVSVSGSASTAIAMLLSKQFKCSPLGSKNYYGESEYVRPIKKNQLVGFENIPDEPTIWWRGKRPLIVSGETHNLSLTFLRGIYQRDELIQEAIDEFNQEKNQKNWKRGDRFFIRKKHGSIGSHSFQGGSGSGKKRPEMTEDSPEVASPSSDTNKYTTRPLKWKREELGQPKNDGAIDKLSLCAHAIEAIEEAILWRDSEEWFKERSIPWKRGWLLHGIPGCVIAGTKIKIRKKKEGKHIIYRSI